MVASSQRRLRSDELLRNPGTEADSDARPTELVLGSHTVAYMSGEYGRVNALRSTSALGMPAIEVLAGLTSQNPTGVVLIEHGDDGLGFCVEQGRVVGAYGTGKHGVLEAWCDTAQDQGIQAKPGMGGWTGLMATYVERCVLERLHLATLVGSSLTVIRGEVKWAGARLDITDASSLSNMLMEHAREDDDRSKFEKRLAPLDRFAFPSLDPEEAAVSGVFEAVEVDSECSFAGMAEGLEVDDGKLRDMKILWGLADGRSTLDELAQRCLLGRARSLAALHNLARKGCIELSAARPAPEARPRAVAVDLDRLHRQYRDTSILQELVESFIGNMPGWIAELDNSAARGDYPTYARLCGHIIGASGAVAAMPLLTLAARAQKAALAREGDLIAHLEALESAYGEAFRDLLTLHGGQ